MRLWHTTFAVLLVALLLTVLKEAAGRVAIVMFVTGTAELVCGIAAIMMLFQTLGSLGHAKGLLEAVQCLLATLLVTTVAAGMMVAVLTLGAMMVGRVV